MSVIVMGLFRRTYSPSDVNCRSGIRFFSWNPNFTFVFIGFLGFHLFLGRVNRIRLHCTAVYCVAGWTCCYGLLLIFMRVRKIAESDNYLRHIWPSVVLEQLGSHWTDFHKIWYLNIFWKAIENIQVSLKTDKNNGYFIWKTAHIYHNISFISS